MASRIGKKRVINKDIDVEDSVEMVFNLSEKKRARFKEIMRDFRKKIYYHNRFETDRALYILNKEKSISLYTLAEAYNLKPRAIKNRVKKFAKIFLDEDDIEI